MCEEIVLFLFFIAVYTLKKHAYQAKVRWREEIEELILIETIGPQKYFLIDPEWSFNQGQLNI